MNSNLPAFEELGALEAEMAGEMMLCFSLTYSCVFFSVNSEEYTLADSQFCSFTLKGN